MNIFEFEDSFVALINQARKSDVTPAAIGGVLQYHLWQHETWTRRAAIRLEEEALSREKKPARKTTKKRAIKR